MSVINAPAGSGKTRVLAEAARIWAEAGLGPVIGITPSQSARNTLAAGVPVSYNSAQFLGHLPGRRGARGPVPIGPGTLLVIDEASMLSGPDLADLIAYAQARGAKVILAGDVSQLQAVENGGGLSLLAAALGYVRLAEPVRFRHRWEQHASLRLRDGDTTVLADYDQHGRIIGGEPEQMMDAAAAAYVALSADGTDTLLMAADHALRRELSRRIRDELIRLGIVQDGPAVRIADGAQASPGDLIICTRNDHTVEAGEPGRALANGDLLRIEAVTPNGLIVRRALDADPRTGQRRWTDRTFVYANYADAELGLRGHRSCRPGPDRAHRAGGDHRDRGPPARLRGPVPRHRRQPRLRVHRVPEARRPGARPAPGPRTGPLRPPRRRTRPPARRRQQRRGAGGAGRRAGPRRPAALGHPDPRPGPGRRRPPGHPARDLGRRDHPGPPAAVPGPADEHRAARSTAGSRATRRNGCGGRCAPPNWPAWTPRRSWPMRSASGTWPAPATWPPSSTPASATGSAPWSRSRPARGPRRSPRSPTPNAAPTSPRSPR